MNNSSYSPLMSSDEPAESKISLAIVVIIIILMLIGGLFVISTKKSTDTETATTTAPLMSNEESTSTNLDDLENDLIDLEASISDDGLTELDQELGGL